MHCDKHFKKKEKKKKKKSSFDKSTETKSFEANEKFTLNKKKIKKKQWCWIDFFFLLFHKMSSAAVQSLRQLSSSSFDKQTPYKSGRNYVCNNISVAGLFCGGVGVSFFFSSEVEPM